MKILFSVFILILILIFGIVFHGIIDIIVYGYPFYKHKKKIKNGNIIYT